MTLILVILVVLLLFGGGGGYYGYNRGYYSHRGFGGVLGFILILFVVFLLMGRGYHHAF